MNKTLQSAFALAVAALAGIAPQPCRAEPSASDPPVEILYIPQEDLARAPGYAPDGVFLPLSQLTSLVKEAQRKSDAAPRPAAVYCKSVRLAGKLDGESLGQALRLEGTLEFEAPSEGWSAALIADGAMPWTAQESPGGGAPPAFLARLEGRDWLFAKGPGRGAITLRAIVPVAAGEGEATIDFGKFEAPCEIAVALGRGIEMAGSGGAREARVWPATAEAAKLHLRRASELAAAPCLRARIERVATVAGMGLEVEDVIVLRDRFAAGAAIKLPLPPGLKPLRASTPDPCRAEFIDGALVLTPTEALDSITVTAVFAAEIKDSRATLGAWAIPAAAQSGTLTLNASDAAAASPLAIPEPLAFASATPATRRYESWGPLPAVEVALAPRREAEPPRVGATLVLSPGEATVTTVFQFPDRKATEVLFETPEGWSIAYALVPRGDKNIPASIQNQGGRRWRAAWNMTSDDTDVFYLTLHRAGDWGAPGTDAELALPILKIEGARPASYAVSANWPESMDVRADALERLRPAAAGPNVRLLLRAEGADPSGKLLIHGRESDVRATVAADLSIEEDRASVRAQIKYDIRFAPAKTFKFMLPAGTGSDVRIDGEGIRERTLRAEADGDHWTVVTQAGALGEFPLTLQWTLKESPAKGPVKAPEIRVEGAASQRGFIAIEASETLKLTAEAKGLTEAGVEELPAVPWRRASRVLAAYRYIEPPFSLAVRAERFVPDPGLLGVAREAELATAISPDGERLTRASYTLAPTRDRQFFEFELPPGAQLWSVLVDGQGAKPAMRQGEGGKRLLLVPLPAGSAEDRTVAATYRERSEPLTRSTRLRIDAPKLPFPVNRTVWDVSLPPGFEWLAYGGDFMEIQPARPSLVAWLRTAYYPSRLLAGLSAKALVFWVSVVAVIAFFWRKRAARRQMSHEEPAFFTTGRVIFYLAIALAIAILSSLAVPNFLEAQDRAKISRIKADQRSMATAIESYYVDNNAYPTDPEILWQGPVKYMNAPYADPYAQDSEYGGGATYRYKFGREALEAAARAGLLQPGVTESPGGFWLAYSVGPDGQDDGGALIYDPTNGTESRGDVVRISANYGYDNRFSEMNSRQAMSSAAPPQQQMAQAPAPEPPQPMQMPAPQAAQTAAGNEVYRLKVLKNTGEQESRDFKMVLESMGYLPVYIVPAASGKNVYYGNFASRNDALKMKNKLERDGFSVDSVEKMPRQIAQAPGTEEGYYSVLVGEYGSPDEAPKIKEQIEKQGLIGGRLEGERVLIGKFRSSAEATNLAVALQERGYPSAKAIGIPGMAPEARVDAGEKDRIVQDIVGSGRNLTPEERKAIDELVEAKLKAAGSGGGNQALVNQMVELEKRLSALGTDVSKIGEHVDKFAAQRENESRQRVWIAQNFRAADTLAKAGKIPEALEQIRAILNVEPENAMALTRLRMLESMGQGEAFEGQKGDQDKRFEQMKSMAQQEETRGSPASLIQAKSLWQQIATIHERYAPEAEGRIAMLDQKIRMTEGEQSSSAASPSLLGGIADSIGRIGEKIFRPSGDFKMAEEVDAPAAAPKPTGAIQAAPRSASQADVTVYTANSTSESLSGGSQLANIIDLDFENDPNAPSGWMGNERDGGRAAAGPRPARTAARRMNAQAGRPASAEAPASPDAPVTETASEVIIGDLDNDHGTSDFNFADAINLDAMVSDDNTAAGAAKLSYIVAKRARMAGLLSLDIEMPRGGSQRRFETLGEAANVDVRLLEEKRFLRIRFAIWLGVALLLAAVRLFSPRAYRRAFAVALAAALLVPAAWPGAWNTFFNAAAVGVVLSLLAPAFGAVAGKLSGRAPVRAAALLGAFALAAISSSDARAQEPATAIPMQSQGPSVTAASDGMSGRRPDLHLVDLLGGAPRILVPYNVESAAGLPPHLFSDPLAFMSRATFTRLWEEAQGPACVPGGPRVRKALVQSLSLEGKLDPAASSIEGTLVVRAASLDDAPTTAPLKLGSLALKSVAASEPGATLESTKEGLLLRLAPRWSGTVTAAFTAPCGVAGGTGSADFDFPESASGLWRVSLPYADATSSGAGIVERGEGEAALVGAARPGVAHLAWAASGPRRAAAEGAESAWRAEIETSVIWHNLAAAEWTTTFIAEAAGSGALLPARLRFKLDPAVRVFGAEGESLLGATTGDGEIAFDIAPGPSAKIAVRGLIAPPAPSQPWGISGLQAPEGSESKTLLWIYVAPSIDLGSIDPKGLERKEEPPAAEGDRAMRLRYAAASEPWSARVELARARPSFSAEVRSAFAPSEGRLWSGHRIELAPSGAPLRGIDVKLPAGARAVAATVGGGEALWTQGGGAVSIAFNPPLAGAARMEIVAVQESVGASFGVAPIEIAGAPDARQRALVALPVDLELKETDLAGASPLSPDEGDQDVYFTLLAGRVQNAAEFGAGPRRAYALAPGAALKLEAAPAPLQAATTIHNRVTISEGLRSLAATAVVEPRGGRIREVRAMLLLPAPDPGVPARLQATGPVRRVRTEQAGERLWRVAAELDSPQSGRVAVSFQLDSPTGADESAPVGAPLLLPEGAGERAFLLLRREFEGALAGAALAGLRPADPASVAWPDDSFRPRPSDQVFELSPATMLAESGAAPTFKIVRHAREAALRAVVDLLRQRTILAPDGVERNELEMVVQNQSEQFLKIALPYPKSAVTIYETRVAGRPVKAALDEIGGRAVVSAPLVRTGLLEPELAVRVAYSVRGREAVRGSGSREQKLPEILGGVPVAQSALILMLPPGLEYSRFKGTLSPIELADLEIEEARLKAENLRKLSEAALQTTGEKQREALRSLNTYQAEVNSKLEQASSLNAAVERRENESTVFFDKAESGRKKALKGERASKSAQAAQEQQVTFRNQGLLNERVQQLDAAQVPSQTASQTASQTPSQTASQTAARTPEPPPPPAPPASAQIEFPRVGEVFVFRQIQGTGNVTFKFASREAAGRRKDVLLGIVAVLGAAGLLALGRSAFATRRRAGLLLLAVCVAAGLARFALDLAIPGIAVALWLLATADSARAAAAREIK